MSDGSITTNADSSFGSPGFNSFWQNFANQTLSLGFGYGKAKLQQDLQQDSLYPYTQGARAVDALGRPILGSNDPMLFILGVGLVAYLALRD